MLMEDVGNGAVGPAITVPDGVVEFCPLPAAVGNWKLYDPGPVGMLELVWLPVTGFAVELGLEEVLTVTVTLEVEVKVTVVLFPDELAPG